MHVLMELNETGSLNNATKVTEDELGIAAHTDSEEIFHASTPTTSSNFLWSDIYLFYIPTLFQRLMLSYLYNVYVVLHITTFVIPLNLSFCPVVICKIRDVTN